MNNRVYHATSMTGVENIFTWDCLRVSASKELGLETPRISFSRQPQSVFVDRPAVLVFDADRIRHNHRLVPRYGDSRLAARMAAANPREYLPITSRRGTEESLDHDLSKIHRYLDCLVTSEYWWDLIQKAVRRGCNGSSGINLLKIFQYLREYRIPVLPTNLAKAGWQVTLDEKSLHWN